MALFSPFSPFLLHYWWYVRYRVDRFTAIQHHDRFLHCDRRHCLAGHGNTHLKCSRWVDEPLFGWNLDMDWTGIIDEVNIKILSDGYSLFTIFFMLMLFKGILASIAGPAPNYDMQKILSTKSPQEASKMSGFASIALMPTRYLMIGGFSVLALLFYDRLDLRTAGLLDFEKSFPQPFSSLYRQDCSAYYSPDFWPLLCPPLRER